jgi:hypothetical protein
VVRSPTIPVNLRSQVQYPIVPNIFLFSFAMPIRIQMLYIYIFTFNIEELAQCANCKVDMVIHPGVGGWGVETRYSSNIVLSELYVTCWVKF